MTVGCQQLQQWEAQRETQQIRVVELDGLALLLVLGALRAPWLLLKWTLAHTHTHTLTLQSVTLPSNTANVICSVFSNDSDNSKS